MTTRFERLGDDETAQALYPFIQTADDGTWYNMLQPDAFGLGIATWLTSPFSVEDIYATDYSTVSEIRNVYTIQPTFTTAFVTWRSTPLTLMHGLWVEVDSVRCYDSTENGYEYSFRSQIFNLWQDVQQGFNHVRTGLPRLPVWTVTPIDGDYFYPWRDEAETYWDALDIANINNSLTNWVCCQDAESHYWSHDSADDISCASYEIDHSCGRDDTGPRGADCEYFECAPTPGDDLKCDCGLSPTLNELVSAVDRAQPLVDTEAAIFTQTWSYALESSFRGWNRVYDLKEGVPWFSSFWHQRSPFSSRPGLAPLVQAQLGCSTDSSTQEFSLRAS